MLEALQQQFGDVIQSAQHVGQGIRVRITPDSLPAVCQWCKGQGYTYLHDLTAVDTGAELRLVYRLFSLASGGDVVLTVPVPRAGARVPSIADIYRAADWAEREVYDLFGVRFDGHPNLRRILLDDDWEGHPLLKQTN
jgi:NADH-quinone oxidoreductase subunit C